MNPQLKIKPIASGSSGNCYYISDGKTNLLIECGITFKKIQQAIGFKVSNLSGVLISHEHKDHCKAVKDMLKAGIDVFASRGTIEALGLSGYRVRTIKAKKQFKVGTWTILPFETVHSSEELPCKEPLGFLLVSGKNRILFATDTAYIKPKVNGLTHILIECNYQTDILQDNINDGTVEYSLKKRLLKTHMSLDQTIGFLKANDLSKVQEIHLIHISSRNSDATIMRDAVIKETGKPVFCGHGRSCY